mmetsp:Transcript_621/g.1479  ORF Transcript_621/g.1479 Transcript_621/m.1479 type:complete len:268 (+) Transcript_621:235-1038(+)|eukprot:CAMPEP_0172374490 /NCGR_PEP_ID=MMETSP1060-20121228/56001_1 /TAXON_ID=37318 /ORGANISM="Pseudo-nitzschia pungens, Strain cf. cingulata" /LENGTH=267 /DNA_ID=CAMNT_0013101187 /DNA_START=194 /DNA_END=997 /DNA_ORIENTATION=+
MSFLDEWHKHQRTQRNDERDRKRNASAILHSYRGGRHSMQEIEEQRALKEVDREKKVNASNILRRYRGGENYVKGSERVASKEQKLISDHKNTRYCIPDISFESGRERRDCSARKSRELLSVNFSFGLIYNDWEPQPGIDSCTNAASVIIPHIVGQWSNDTKVFCNVKTPEIVGEISTDDWYESEDSIRYVVRGTVPVFIFVESSAKETIAPLQKVLKRHVSFRPLKATEVKIVAKDRRAQFIIGSKGAEQWIRVRESRLSGLGITF